MDNKNAFPIFLLILGILMCVVFVVCTVTFIISAVNHMWVRMGLNIAGSVITFFAIPFCFVALGTWSRKQ